MSDLSRDVAYWQAAHLELAERLDQVEAEVTRYVEAYKSAHDRAQQAEAEVTRLMARWEALKVEVKAMRMPGQMVSGGPQWSAACARDKVARELQAKMTDLEAQR